MTKYDGERERLIDRLAELMNAADVRASAAQMSMADLRSVIADCEAQERRYAAAGFEPIEF